MLNRRSFLASLLAGSAAATTCDGPPPVSTDEPRIWVLVGVNWEHNDEANYPVGGYLTEHVYTDKGLADRVCSDLIRRFRDSDDPDDYIGPSVSQPDGWHDWSKDQKWDWLFGSTENPSRSETDFEDGFGWVSLPFEVREMRLPASALAQQGLAITRLNEDLV
jgi:hypothetical protein